jgi:hypothetical protein
MEVMSSGINVMQPLLSPPSVSNDAVDSEMAEKQITDGKAVSVLVVQPII